MRFLIHHRRHVLEPQKWGIERSPFLRKIEPHREIIHYLPEQAR
jgi:hypothetical protein